MSRFQPNKRSHASVPSSETALSRDQPTSLPPLLAVPDLLRLVKQHQHSEDGKAAKNEEENIALFVRMRSLVREASLFNKEQDSRAQLVAGETDERAQRRETSLLEPRVSKEIEQLLAVIEEMWNPRSSASLDTATTSRTNPSIQEALRGTVSSVSVRREALVVKLDLIDHGSSSLALKQWRKGIITTLEKWYGKELYSRNDIRYNVAIVLAYLANPAHKILTSDGSISPEFSVGNVVASMHLPLA